MTTHKILHLNESRHPYLLLIGNAAPKKKTRPNLNVPEPVALSPIYKLRGKTVNLLK